MHGPFQIFNSSRSKCLTSISFVETLVNMALGGRDAYLLDPPTREPESLS